MVMVVVVAVVVLVVVAVYVLQNVILFAMSAYQNLVVLTLVICLIN